MEPISEGLIESTISGISPENGGETLVRNNVKLWLAKNKAALLKAGVAKISGDYSGYGDEGRWDGTRALNNQGCWLDDYEVPAFLDAWLDTIAMALASGTGYQDNDGGGGSIELDVEAGTVTHRSYWNEYVQVDNDEQEL